MKIRTILSLCALFLTANQTQATQNTVEMVKDANDASNAPAAMMAAPQNNTGQHTASMFGALPEDATQPQNASEPKTLKRSV